MTIKNLELIIEENAYEGIFEQDGWETLEATVRSKQAAAVADQIMEWFGFNYAPERVGLVPAE